MSGSVDGLEQLRVAVGAWDQGQQLSGRLACLRRRRAHQRLPCCRCQFGSVGGGLPTGLGGGVGERCLPECSQHSVLASCGTYAAKFVGRGAALGVGNTKHPVPERKVRHQGRH